MVRKIKSHIIVRLKITQKNIEDYLKNKITGGCGNLLQEKNILPKAFREKKDIEFKQISGENNENNGNSDNLLPKFDISKYDFNVNHVNIDKNCPLKKQILSDDTCSESKIKIRKCF